jgi:hypothetical protein
MWIGNRPAGILHAVLILFKLHLELFFVVLERTIAEAIVSRDMGEIVIGDFHSCSMLVS